ncbi:MAG: hypothetical protein IKF90_21175 [Parasporobacterium sp.]|nr:hypothetical protein [Parasporobacterium sp.]
MSNIFVRVKNFRQLEAVLPYPQTDTVIMDFAFSRAEAEEWKKNSGEKKICLQLPKVLREKRKDSVRRIAETALILDGVVLCNFDELGLWKEIVSRQQSAQPLVIGDAFLYTYNIEALLFYRNFFPDMKFLLPDELTDKETEDLIEKAEQKNGFSGEEFIYKIYGYQELMITAQCLQKNYFGCRKENLGRPKAGGSAGELKTDKPVKVRENLLAFSDEKKNSFFAAAECSNCYNIIYNGQPTVMLDKTKKSEEGFLIDRTNYQNILFDFTIETPEEIHRILEGFFEEKSPETYLPEKLTRGHHYKGVQ